MIETDSEERIFSQVGGWLCLDFTNTGDGRIDTTGSDYFNSYGDLTLWARQQGLLSHEEQRSLDRTANQKPGKAQEVLEQAKSLRSTIYGIFDAITAEQEPASALLRDLNSALAEAMSYACIEHGPEGYWWGWSGFPQKLESLLWPIVRSAADLLVDAEKLERVSECASDACGWLFVDTSKNHSRRWCDMRDCGNAAKARRHYHRRVKAQQ